ncbi:unnamed protein product [Durusdinium trenchii]|uniref:Sulfur deprivation response regulator n=2 Tax=Durusdinium trenchii TaxID=1381693 RepID=A0ABP0PU09_9DINO
MLSKFLSCFGLLLPTVALRAIFDGEERDTGGRGIIPHRRLVMVVYPAMAVAAVLFICLFVTALGRAPGERKKTGRKSIKDYRLMQHLGVSDAVEELHPETSFTEDFGKAFTRPRLFAFLVAIALTFALAVFGDNKLFAVEHSLANVASVEACQAACSANPLAHCDSLKFEKRFCTPLGKYCAAQKSKSSTVEFVSCSFSIVPEAWKVDLVVMSAIIGIFLIVDGLSAELILFGLSCIYGIFGVISKKEVWAGLGSGSVVALALLFPIAAAIEETGVLDCAIGAMLGSPQSFHVAFFRMLIPVALLSAFLSNTAIVTMMIPIIVSWSRTLGVHPGKLLMPLSFAAQLGGSCTLIGSSHCLVARESVDKDLYEMSFFDLSYSGAILSFATFFIMALSLPFLASSATPETRQDDAAETVSRENLYAVNFSLWPQSPYVGMDFAIASMQLKRLSGVQDMWRKTEEHDCLTGSEEVCFLVDEIGVISLRQMKGLRIASEDALRALGMERERRHLYEACLAPGSMIADEPFDFDALRQGLGACPIAIRGKDAGACVPEAGDIVLLEADERYVAGKLWQEVFSITKPVPNSSPIRVGGVHDQLRCMLVCLGMAILIVLVTLEVVDLAAGAGIFVLFLVLTNAYSMTAVYKAIKGPVLLTIAGASGLSMALQASGVAMFAARRLTQYALPGGSICVRVAVYVLSAFLSMFMNNSATVAVLGPMLATISRSACDDDILCQQRSMKALTQVMVFAAGTCLTSPLGYQTNLMVMKDGGYTFGDFTKYGGLIQVFHLICCVAVVSLLVDSLDL